MPHSVAIALAVSMLSPDDRDDDGSDDDDDNNNDDSYGINDDDCYDDNYLNLSIYLTYQSPCERISPPVGIEQRLV